jgi:mRNA interferase HicA
MKLSEFVKYLKAHHCNLLREGASHSWWEHSDSKKRSSVPRHKEINDNLARKICKDSGIEPIK